MQDASLKACCICSSPTGASPHFGAVSCLACAAFFRRTVSLNIEFKCTESNTCKVYYEQRIICKACRYQRCLLAGMKSECVQKRKCGKKLSKEESPRSISPRDSNISINFNNVTKHVVSPSTSTVSNNSINNTSTECFTTPNFSPGVVMYDKPIPTPLDPLEALRSVDILEYCVEEEKRSMERRRIMFSRSPLEALLGCNTPFTVDDLIPFTVKSHNTHMRFDHLLSFEYTKNLPGFNQLSIADRIIVFRYVTMGFCALDIAYLTSQMNMVDRGFLVFTNATYFSINNFEIGWDDEDDISSEVHQETYGKTGCRRIIPGEYLAADPKGRAVLVGAIERQKLVYIMNRDAQANLTISSPLEAHRSYSVCYAVIGLDVGFENPTFACLEVEYEDADQDPSGDTARNAHQSLTFYELDLGLNHVVRKYSEPLQERGNHLIPVPGGNDGPSGVIVCCENVIVYKNLGDQQDIRVPIPRRRNDLEHETSPLMVIASASHKTKSIYFFLIQLENGDLFKITLDTEGDIVTDMHLKYFDTVSPANSMCILKTGFLFIAAEFGNHQLYQIARLGTDDAEGVFSSRTTKPGLYNCRELYNLVLVDSVDSLDPLTQTYIGDLASEDAPQIYALCGRGGRSTLRVLRNGLEVSEMAISELPGNPQNVWTVRRTVDDSYHSYIVVAFANATLVLAIQESIEEVPDSGFLGTAPTIGCGLIGDDSLLQVYPGGLRHIKSDRRINEWKAPSRRHIVNCAINRRQVVIALSGGEIIYFELDVTNQLREFSERRELPADVLCMSVSEIPEGELRSRFLTVGLSDRTVRVISLDPADCLSPLSMQAIQADPSSLLIIETPDEGGSSMMYMNIGLANGCLMRTTIDQVTGELADTRLRYLGTRPVTMFKIIVQGRDAVIATSSRSWVLYHYQNRFHLTPLSYMALDSASSFVSPQCSEGIVAVARSTLRILALDKLGAVFNQTTHKLKFTPRRFVPLFHTDNVIIIETDHASFTEKAKKDRRNVLMEGAETLATSGGDEREQYGAHELRNLYSTLNNDESKFGAPRNHNNTWASSIRLINATRGNTMCHFELPDGEAAFCVELVHFRSNPESLFVLVGCASNLQLVPHHKPSGGCVYTFLVHKNGQGFEFIHGTPTDEPVYAIHSFKGVVLIGCGRKLRLYDMGKRRLLKKCENKQIPCNIVDIKSIGGRIIVSDLQESIHFLRYRSSDNRMVVFADDTTPRYVKATCILDYDTVAVGDRFGNIAILRLPKDVTDDIQDDPTGVRALYDRGNLNGAPQKIEMISHFYVGSMITTLQKTNLVPGAEDALVYSTISGAIGMFVPFVSRDEFELFQTLEMHMRVEFPPLCGRDHLAYRSFYAPIKNVVDGDMCEQFGMIEATKQREISENLGRKTTEVAKKLEDMRTRYAY